MVAKLFDSVLWPLDIRNPKGGRNFVILLLILTAVFAWLI